jgi:hypothetical protein
MSRPNAFQEIEMMDFDVGRRSSSDSFILNSCFSGLDSSFIPVDDSFDSRVIHATQTLKTFNVSLL